MHIVVTGASSGIGRDIAKAFDAPGNKLSLVARRGALLGELQKEIRTTSWAIEADLAADPIGWLRRAETDGGPVDVLVNNAGTSYVEPVELIDEARIRAMYQLNVATPIAAMRHAVPAMRSRGSGTIVNVASVAAFTAAPFMCDYHATKGALGNFSESLRLELRGTGVNVVSVYPGPVHTPMAERNFDRFHDADKLRRVPTGNSATLARLVHRAVVTRKARVIYPRFYLLAWWLPGVARLAYSRVVPRVVGGTTPPLGGDGS